MKSGMAGARRAIAATIVLTAATGISPVAHAGNLTTAHELASVALAAQSSASLARSLETLQNEAARSWRWGQVGGNYVTTLQGGAKACHPESAPAQVDYFKEGAPDAFAKALAYHLRTAPDETSRLALAQEARQRVLDLVDTSGFHGLGSDWSGENQCILELGVSIPIWIETALLLGETPVWKATDRAAFAGWLAEQVFPKVAWASRVRRNNWGAAGSLAASLVARYVNGVVPQLTEVAPSALTLSPAAAAQQHDAQQLLRIGTSWRGDSSCAVYGIQDHGGIPDELRRGAGGCNATFIPSATDTGLTYQTMQVELLVFHAEAVRRAGSRALFDAKTPAGASAIQRAILFVIANPSGGPSWPWGPRTGALWLAARAYGSTQIARAAEGGSFRGGRTLPYAALTGALPSSSSGSPPPPQLFN